MNLSLGGTESSPNRIPKHTLSPQKVKREQTQLISKHAVWSVWDGNRILQDYNGRHVFTTVYEADSFVPLARVVWLDEQLSRAANDVPNAEQLETLNNLQQLTLSNLEGFESLDADAFKLPHAQNDDAHEHSSHQIYWYQNDHLGTPRELTEQGGEIAWEAVYQAWGNTVTVEWEEKAQPNPIQLNTLEQIYLLQPHRFQGQIYDVETGLHYNRFRYYDPDCGRFISHDPIGLLGGDNHFQYAPNPVEWVDPWGLSKKPNACSKLCYSNEELEKLGNKLPTRGSYEQAMKQAMGWLEDRGFKAEKVNKGKFGTIKGKAVGMTTANGKIGFRIEYDERSKAHINVFNGKEKGPHCFFEATEKTVSKLQRLFGK